MHASTASSSSSHGEISFAEEFVVSGVAACMAKSLFAPIERVKLLVQNQSEILRQGVIDRPYRGNVECCLRVVREDGVRALWRGNMATVYRYFPSQAINFPVRSAIKRWWDVDERRDGYLVWFASNIASGSLAGVASLCVIYPLDYGRTRLGNDRTRFTGLTDVLRQTYHADGVAGLYRGFNISCFGVVVYRGLSFGLYDSFKPLFARKDTASFHTNFAAGWLSTAIANFVAYPLDTVRHRMMMRSGEAVKYASAWDCARTIVRVEGAPALMKGATVNILRSFAGAGVLSGVDYMKPVYTRWRAHHGGAHAQAPVA